jgi:hypothetical protein
LVKDKAIDKMNKNVLEYKESIACAYCHRIKSIEHHKKANKNIILKKKGVYYGTRNPEIRSDYHKIINTNVIHKNGDTCMGCHSHKQNDKGFVVCETESNNTLKQNCITCHMPQVEGSLSDRVETPTHAFHGFAGVRNSPELLAKYIDLKIVPKNGYFEVVIINKAPHSLFLHPLRVAKLIIKIGDKKIEKSFVRLIGHNKKPSPPWLATEVVKDNMIKAKEKRVIRIDEDIKGKKIVLEFGYYIVNPKMAKKFHLEEFAKFRLLKRVEL